VPLQAGREFVDCRCGIRADNSLTDAAEYERIADTVMALLSDPDRVAESRRAAADYYDGHAPRRALLFFGAVRPHEW
jgi:hypothetical protein